MQLTINPCQGSTPEARAHNKALFERYMPEFPAFFLEARSELGARWGTITIDVPEGDLDFVQSLMDPSKVLVK